MRDPIIASLPSCFSRRCLKIWFRLGRSRSKSTECAATILATISSDQSKITVSKSILLKIRMAQVPSTTLNEDCDDNAIAIKEEKTDRSNCTPVVTHISNPLHLTHQSACIHNSVQFNHMPMTHHVSQMISGYAAHCPSMLCTSASPRLYLPYCDSGTSTSFNNVAVGFNRPTQLQIKMEQWRELTRQMLMEMQGSNCETTSTQQMERIRVQTEMLRQSIFYPQHKTDFSQNINNRVQPSFPNESSPTLLLHRSNFNKDTNTTRLFQNRHFDKSNDRQSITNSRRMRRRIRDAKMRLLKHHWMQKHVSENCNTTPDISFPTRPLTAYMRFSTSIYESIRAKYPDAKLPELGKLTGEMWRNLDDARKQVLIFEYEADKAHYEHQMQIIKNDPICQTILSDKQSHINLKLPTLSKPQLSQFQIDNLREDAVRLDLKQKHQVRKKIMKPKVRRLKRTNVSGKHEQRPSDIPLPPIYPFQISQCRAFRTRQPLIDEYQAEKERYTAEMKAYKESPTYQQYIRSINEPILSKDKPNVNSFSSSGSKDHCTPNYSQSILNTIMTKQINKASTNRQYLSDEHLINLADNCLLQQHHSSPTFELNCKDKLFTCKDNNDRCTKRSDQVHHHCTDDQHPPHHV
ncbi:hypothetical protein GJ496_001668 [Pomphorhynchus laevis]|nr:hypothetical protein GJ496_001668 [Pomphorhynchus laevis]